MTDRSLIRSERDEGEIWRRLAEGAIRDLGVCRVLVRVANVRRQGGEGCCGLARGAAAEAAGGAGKGDGGTDG